MSGSVPSPKPPKVKRQHNKFLYDIVNQLKYDEFKEYTNFAEVMQRVLNEKTDLTEQKRLEHYIKQNFRKNIPNESNWKKGGFVSLKLTDDFYRSETAGRIFQKLYGIKTCKIDLWNQGSSFIHRDDSKNQSDEMEIDLTGDNGASSNGGIYPPKRRIIYPRKIIDPHFAGPSGIATYSATSKHAEQKQMSLPIISDEFNDEICVSSTESLLTDLNSNAGAEAGSKTRMEFSVVSPPCQGYVSPTPKIGSKSQNEKVSKSASPLKQATTEEPNLPQGESSRHINTWMPLENVEGCVDESPSKTLESDMINVFRRSFKAQLPVINERLEQYVATSEPSTLSLKNFWCEFVKVKYENDSSAAETQLNNSILNEEVGVNHIEDQSYKSCDIQVKMENIFEEISASNSSDVEMIKVPNEPPICILLDSSQELIDNLQDDNNSEEHFIGPFAISQLPIGSCNKKKSARASSSKRFLTALPNISGSVNENVQQWLKDVATHAIDLQSNIESGTCTVDSVKDTTVIEKLVAQKSVGAEHDSKVMLERNLLEHDHLIKSCLQLTSADVDRAVELMNSYKELKFTKFILTKHNVVVQTMREMRRYVGNTKKWGFTDDEKEEFDLKAGKVRALAESIYNSFESLFDVPEGREFFSFFNEGVRLFKEKTSHLTPDELLYYVDDEEDENIPDDETISVHLCLFNN